MRCQPFNFKGEWQTYCHLLDGPVRDFNVMSARAKFPHACEVITSPGSIDWRSHTEILLVYCFEGKCILEGANDRQIELDTRYTLLLEKRSDGPKNLPLKVSASSIGMVAVIVKISNL